MEDYQERVIKEQHNLRVKIGKLNNFIVTDTFKNLDDQNKLLLIKQRDIMEDYSDILKQRINLFT